MSDEAKRILSLLQSYTASTLDSSRGGLLSSSVLQSNPAAGGLLRVARAPTVAPSSVGWDFVEARFTSFLLNLKLTEKQYGEGVIKVRGLTSVLNMAYRGLVSERDNSFLIGSWAKNTCIRPPRDIDMYYILPIDVYQRFEKYSPGSNKQSALLQEVKSKLLTSYSTSSIKGDGPVVVVNFSGWKVEVVPAFLWDSHSREFLVCNTKEGGRYEKTKPLHEVDAIDQSDEGANGNARPLIRMLKCWQHYCSVNIRSFYLEILAVEFLSQWKYKSHNLFFYDWMCRDFFKWMLSKENTFIWAPGTYELLWLGNAWKSKVESALARASKAESFEHENKMIEAGEEWQKIFGVYIPRSVG